MGVFRADHLENSRTTTALQAQEVSCLLSKTFNNSSCTSKQYFSPRMELWTGLMTVLESALRSRLPKALIGIDTDSWEQWCL